MLAHRVADARILRLVRGWLRAGRRLTRKLHAVRTKQRHRMHAPLSVQHRWLCSVLRGHYRYYGLPSTGTR